MGVSFKVKEIGLLIFRDEKERLFELKTDFKMKMDQKPDNLELRLKLESFLVEDYLHKYLNPDLEKLMTSVPPGVDAEMTKEDLIKVTLRKIEKTHPSYQKTKTATTIEVNFGYFYINFKPDTLQAIMNFFLPPSNLVEPVQKPQQSEELVFVKDDIDHISIDLKATMETLCFRLVHQRSHLLMAELELTKFGTQLKMCSQSLELTGTLDNLKLSDMTNYPRTIHLEEDYLNIRPYQLIAAAEGSQNFLSLSFAQYGPKHPNAKLESKVFSFAKVELSSLKIVYLQQPILRLIDYLTGQLLPSIRPGTLEIIKVDRETAEANLKALQFMDIQVVIQNPIVVLKPEPDSTEFLEILVGIIDVNSERVEDRERIKVKDNSLEFVYCERYNIRLADMEIFKVNKKDEQAEVKSSLSRKANFTFFFERLLFGEEYAILDDHHDLNLSMKLVGGMSPFLLTIVHEDYLLVMRCLFFNITYTDERDEFYLTDIQALTNSEAQEQLGSKYYLNEPFCI